MNSAVIPTPYPSTLGGNAARYESTPAPTMKGGKKRTYRKKDRTYRKKRQSRKQKR